MDIEIFVQNIKKACQDRGLKPTNACIESGVGRSFISDIERGRIPSVAKVQMFAAFLGVTTSELLGETGPPWTNDGDKGVSNDAHKVAVAYDAAGEKEKTIVRIVLDL